VDTSRVSLGEWIAAVAAAALFLFLFLTWSAGLSAWELFDFVDVILAVIAFVVLAIVLIHAGGRELTLPMERDRLIAGLGGVAFVIVLSFLLEASDRGAGIWLALLATIAIVYGGLSATRGADAALGTRPRGRTRPVPPPPADRDAV
jgi:hypothetical protein